MKFPEEWGVLEKIPSSRRYEFFLEGTLRISVELVLSCNSQGQIRSSRRCRGCTPSWDEAFFVVFAFKICIHHQSVMPFLSGAPPPKKNPGSVSYLSPRLLQLRWMSYCEFFVISKQYKIHQQWNSNRYTVMILVTIKKCFT